MSLSEFSPQYLRLEERGDVLVAAVEAPFLTEDMNLEQFGHELFALVDQLGFRKLVVSMSKVRMVTSGGLGKMITVHRKMHRQKGTIVFCDLQEAVTEILDTSRLITYLCVTADVESALKSLPQE